VGALSSPGPRSVTCEVIRVVVTMMQFSSLAHLRSKIYPLVVESIFRVLQAEITTHRSADGASHSCSSPQTEDEDIPHDRLLAWALLVGPHMSDTLLAAYMPHFIAFVEYFVVDDVARTKLFAESAMVLLVDTVRNASGEEIMRSPALLHAILSHPLVAASMLDDDDVQAAPKCPNITTRERFVTALCRVVVKMLPVNIARFIAANQSSPLLSSSVEEIMQLASDTKAATSSQAKGTEGGTSSSTPPSSVFGNDAIDLFSTNCADDVAGSLITPDLSSEAANDAPSTSFSGLRTGLGVHLEIPGVSLRTLQPPRAGQRQPAETALEEFHRLVACGVLVARAARCCFLWRNDGLSGVVAQHCYVDMLQSLAEVLTPIYQGDVKNMELIEQRQSSSGGGMGAARSASQAPSHQSLLQLSVIWARAAFTDLVHSILTLLSETLDRQGQDHSVQGIGSATISHGVMLPFVKFMSQYLKTMFGDTTAKPKQEKVLKLITHLLMQRSLSQTAKSVSTVRSSTPPSGALGGDEPTNLGERATDVAVLAPLQLKALECLEGERDLHESNLLVLFTSS